MEDNQQEGKEEIKDLLALNDSSFDTRNLDIKSDSLKTEDQQLMEQVEKISPSEVKETPIPEVVQVYDIGGSNKSMQESSSQQISGSEEFDIFQAKSVPITSEVKVTEPVTQQSIDIGKVTDIKPLTWTDFLFCCRRSGRQLLGKRTDSESQQIESSQDIEQAREQSPKFKQPLPKRQKVDSRMFHTLSPQKQQEIPETQILQLKSTHGKDFQKLPKQTEKSVFSQHSSKKSIQSKNSYVNLINKLHKQKTILETYYSGPAKFETQFIPTQDKQEKRKPAKEFNFESQAQLNLVSESGNDKMSLNFKQRIDTQDRIDLTAENPEPLFKLPSPVFKAPDSQNTKLNSELPSAVPSANKFFTFMNQPAEEILKEEIMKENEGILIHQQKQTDHNLNTQSLKPKVVNNQNYTDVPMNSQLAIEETEEAWDGIVTFSPDEDTLEELNLPEINSQVFKQVFSANPETLAKLVAGDASILHRMSSRMRQVLGFMKKSVRVYCQQDIEKWQEFLDNESISISQGKFEAVVLLSGSASLIDFKIITQDKICTITFSSQDSVLQWSDSSEEDQIDKSLQIHKMLNGVKFAKEKKLFGGPSSSDELVDPNSIVVSPPESFKECIVVPNPTIAVFAYYRYYLLLEKYKSIVKFNLNHQAYFAKRDKIVELAGDSALISYWHACIMSLVCI